VNKTLYYLGFKSEIANDLQILIEAMYGEKYASVRLDYVQDLKKLDSKTENTVILFIEKLNLEQRRFIWQFKMNYPSTLLVFCSGDMLVANFSWQSGAIFFLPYPFSRRGVALMFQKLAEKYAFPRLKIKLSYQGGFDMVAAEDIWFCEGDGNYTTVYLRNSKSVMLSKKIKDIYLKLASFPEIVRIGKSYIVNIDNITKIDDMKVYFKSTVYQNNSFVLSQVYLKRLKEHILWFTT
jgi:DNA-binding LytR/AlgR family response regulator